MTGLTRRDAARALAATAVMAVAGVSAGAVDPIFGVIEKARAAHVTYERAYRDAGASIPDDDFDALLEPVWDAEKAVALCPPATARGFVAKANFLVERSPSRDYFKTADAAADVTGNLSDEHFLLRLGDDAARLAGEVA